MDCYILYIPSGSDADFLALTSSSPPGKALFIPRGMLLGFPLSGRPPVSGLALPNDAPLEGAAGGAAAEVPSLAAI